MTQARDVDADAWAAALARAPFVPLQQSLAYAKAMARRGREVRRVQVDTPEAGLGAQIIRRDILGIPALSLALRGPLTLGEHPPDAAGLDAVAGALRGRWPHALCIMPEFTDGEGARALLRGVGMRRIMTSQSLAHLDLNDDLAAIRRRAHQKWRNRLARAEAAGLHVDIARGGAALEWLLGAHERLMAAKRFKGLPRAMVLDLVAASARTDVFVVVAHRHRTPIAGALFLRHHADASYVIAATEGAGRAESAGNLVLWRGARALQEAGARTLDLGQVDTDRSPALCRFKLGTGARVVTLCGTWTPSAF